MHYCELFCLGRVVFLTKMLLSAGLTGTFSSPIRPTMGTSLKRMGTPRILMGPHEIQRQYSAGVYSSCPHILVILRLLATHLNLTHLARTYLWLHHKYRPYPYHGRMRSLCSKLSMGMAQMARQLTGRIGSASSMRLTQADQPQVLHYLCPTSCETQSRGFGMVSALSMGQVRTRSS